MKPNSLVKKSLVSLIVLGQLVLPATSYGALSIAQAPLYVGANVKAQVMLDLSKDNQLYYKAFNDYSDLDGDGVIETTYKHGVDYYGYFDSYKCYDYNGGLGRFVPSVYKPKDKSQPDGAAVNLTAKYCAGNWSGNFLNWLSMSRMDAVRKLLYGGFRRVDNTAGAGGLTVLERAFLPTDAHSWAKYYNGTDISQLTPITALNTPSVYTSTTSLEVTRPSFKVGITRSGTTATVTTTTAHNYNVGQKVSILGAANDNGYNGVFTIVATPTANTFTYTVGGGLATPATGLINVFPRQTATISISGYPLSPGDQLSFKSGVNIIEAVVVSTSSNTGSSTVEIEHGNAVGSGTYTSWSIQNLNSTGISFCNTTRAVGYTGRSQDLDLNANGPLIRAALGNYSLWSANERWQCQWSEERNNTQGGFTGGFRSNGNRASQSGIYAAADNPSKTLHAPAGGTEFVARVEVCKTGLLGEERCKQYPSLNYKPIGLLQVYGDINLINFGLMTGTYDKNISGGVLRKNASSFNDEVNIATDGTFLYPATGGIVDTLNRLRLYGYRYDDGSYITGSSGVEDDCPYQTTELVHSGSGTGQRNEGLCSTWGNPMSEIFLESLRYLAGRNANSAFQAGGSGKDAKLGLKEATWVDPLNASNFCAPLNVLMFNTASSTYDDDQLGGVVDLGAGSSASALTTQVGAYEGINGNTWFIGNVGATITDNCTPKVVGGLGDVNGICPESAAYNGTYLMSGIANYAHTNKIRSDLTVPNRPEFKKALKVDTYGIALSTTTPKIDIPVPGALGQKVQILPAYRLDLGTRFGGGTIVDFKVVRQDIANGSGRFYVNWEDSGFGGDFDQDVIGVIDYCVKTASSSCTAVKPDGTVFTPPNGTITVSTDVIAAATANPQGFGYIISGTTQDGVHFHSGIYGFTYPPAPQTIAVPPAPNNYYPAVALDGSAGSGVLGCTGCNITDPRTTWTYTLGPSTSGTLQDPLYYAAKYGGFKDDDGNGLIDAKCDWDSKLGDGTKVDPCTSGADGVPDNFFYVTNPNALEAALDKAFVSILENSSASSVAANSTSLRTGARIYQARFNSNDWSGELRALDIDLAGNVNPTPAWKAQDVLNTQNWSSGRKILTYNTVAKDGSAFTWAAISPAQQTALNLNPASALADGLGDKRLAYLRGDKTNEGNGGGQFRKRNTTVLGDIVNSNPVYVGPPDAGYPDTDYQTFRTTPANFNRPPIIYVAANDGMLHGFCAVSGGACSAGGAELFAYVPSVIYDKLPQLTRQGYTHQYFVDATPTVTDAKVGGAWKTVLVGGVGGGGSGYYALDVTDPANVSEGAAASTVLWEFRKSDDPVDMGVSLSTAQVVRMKNGSFAAVFGNGYNSSSGAAVLYIAFLDGGTDGTWTLGTDFIKVTLPGGANNGLSSPVVSDVDFDGFADYIYAGDLNGNMWKIDVTNSSPASWDSASNKIKLFTAKDSLGNVQPITSAPEVTKAPNGGYIVLFGTGKYLEASDTVGPYKTQTFYSVVDNPLGTAPVTGLLRANLDARTIGTTTIGGIGYRTVAGATTGTAKGWYADLNISGERVVYAPQLRAGKVVFVTLIPSASPCDAGGTSWLIEVDPITGLPLADPVFDTNGDGMINSSDATVSGRQSTVGITPAPTFIGGQTSGGNRDNPRKFLSGSSGQIETVINSDKGSSGRLSWRELLND